MSRPPYLRWLAVGVILLIGVAAEATDRRTVDHPFAASAIAAGAELTSDAIELRAVPADVLVAPAIEGRTARVAIEAGTPLVEALIQDDDGAPDDWWAIPMALPIGIDRGAEVQIALTSTGLLIPGMVVQPAIETGFGFEEAGLVAVPAGHVAAVAAAVASSDIVVAVGMGG